MEWCETRLVHYAYYFSALFQFRERTIKIKQDMKDSKLPKEKKLELFEKIYNLVMEKPNDYELGHEIRMLFIKHIKK